MGRDEQETRTSPAEDQDSAFRELEFVAYSARWRFSGRVVTELEAMCCELAEALGERRGRVEPSEEDLRAALIEDLHLTTVTLLSMTRDAQDEIRNAPDMVPTYRRLAQMSVEVVGLLGEAGLWSPPEERVWQLLRNRALLRFQEPAPTAVERVAQLVRDAAYMDMEHEAVFRYDWWDGTAVPEREIERLAAEFEHLGRDFEAAGIGEAAEICRRAARGLAPQENENTPVDESFKQLQRELYPLVGLPPGESRRPSAAA